MILQRYARGYAWRQNMNRAKQVEGYDRDSVVRSLNMMRPMGRMPAAGGKKGGGGGMGGGRNKFAAVMHGHLNYDQLLNMDPSIPRMRARYKGWLQVRLDHGDAGQTTSYAVMRNGVFTIYKDDSLAVPCDTFPLMDCTLEASDSRITISQPRPMLPSKLKEVGGKKKKKAAAEEEEEEGAPAEDRHTVTLESDSAKASEAGLDSAGVMKAWKENLEIAVTESIEMDDFLIDPEGSGEPADKLMVIKEGMLHSKVIKHDILSGDDHKE